MWSTQPLHQPLVWRWLLLWLLQSQMELPWQPPTEKATP
jgi:hypothetical protein